MYKTVHIKLETHIMNKIRLRKLSYEGYDKQYHIAYYHQKERISF